MRCLSDDALKLLRAGATAITSRPLLASVIMRQFVEWQSGEGQMTWRRPRVLSINAWLTALWKQRRYAEPGTPVLLTTQQETFLWHSVIERDESAAAPLLEVGATARQARLTALACAEYEIPLSDPRWRQDHDPAEFARWLKQLNQMCEREGWITLAQWWRLVPEWLRAETHLGEKLLLAGLEARTPALQRVMTAWEDSGGEVIWEKPLRSCPSLTKTRLTLQPCESQEAEWDNAARWARHLVETNDRASIGILVPDLDSSHARVQRVFDDVFTPGHLATAVSGQKPEVAIESEPVHMNSAAPLREHPVVASAMLLLEAVADRFDIASASALLRSPYLAGAAAERMVRAQADVYMRRSRDLEVSLAFLVRAAKRAPLARRLFLDLQVFLMRRPENADFAYWARFIADLLKLAGWPGDAELSLSELAAVEEWKNSLSTLASLGLVSTTVTWPKAAIQLRRLLAAHQLRGDVMTAPVQILDIRDAASIHFDHVWVLGLSPEHWNLRFDLFPLIPRALQVEAKMPHATAAQQRIHEREMLDALVHAGAEVVASFVKTPLPKLTSLIDERSDFDVNEGGLSNEGMWAGTLWPRAFVVSSELERLPDSEAPHARNAKPTGGTRIIKYQSECPFRAFAEIRLNAIEPEEGTFGFDAMERGQYLHQVLEFVWKQIRTHQRLKEHSASELEALVNEGIAAATATVDEQSEFHRELTEVERLRLGSLILDWLDMEKQRQQPFAVEEMEQGKTVEIEGVTIKLRIDRIDRVKGDKLLLIDYKSGPQRFEKLEGERPEEPQLLVYAAATGDAVEGLIFGQVRRGDLKLVGIAKDQHASGRKLKALGAGWGSQRLRWNETVRRLARDFRQGVATVDPTPKACAFCKIKPLCRIQEIRESGALAEAEGDE
jgi:ATP-dependent helicase/nuclease subunit B